MAAVSCLGFICVFLEKRVELRKNLVTDFGLIQERKEDPEVAKVSLSAAQGEEILIESKSG